MRDGAFGGLGTDYVRGGWGSQEEIGEGTGQREARGTLTQRSQRKEHRGHREEKGTGDSSG